MAGEENRTIHFEDFNKLNEQTRPEGDFTVAEVQRSLEKERKQLQEEFDRLEKQTADLLTQMHTAPQAEKSRLMNEWKAVSQIKQVTKHKLAEIDGRLASFAKNPQSYTNLYNIKENLSSQNVSADLKVDRNGNLEVVVEMMRPSPFGFSIRDGHLTFDNTNVSPEQLKEMLDTLEKMGIKDIRIPDELDKKLKENMEKAVDERNAEADRNYDKDRAPTLLTGENEKTSAANDNGNQGTEDNGPSRPAFESNAPIIPGVNPEYAAAETANLPESKPAPQFSYDYKEFHHKVEFDILQRNMGKIKDSSFFHVKQGGYDKWYVYDTENPDNYDNDGKRGKDGSVAVKNQFVLWAREKDNGSIELGYSMPNGKPISNALADKLISLHKDRGNTHIKFGGMTDDDAGTFRTRCARMGIIPIGIGINEKHAAEMVGEAAKKLSDDELQVFKWRLAQQMRKNIRNSGKAFESDRTAGYIKDLEGDFKFNPFKGAYDDVFKGIIEREKRSNKAENAVGAVYTMEKIFEAYRGGLETNDPGAITMGDVLNPKNNLFTEEEIKAIKNKYAEAQMPLPLDQPMNKLKKDDLTKMFEAVMPIQQKQAAQEMKENAARYSTAKEKDDAVKDVIMNANGKMDSIAGELEQKGLKKIYFSRLNTNMKLGGSRHTQNTPVNAGEGR